MNGFVFLFCFLVLVAAIVGHMLGDLPFKRVSNIVLICLVAFLVVLYGPALIEPFLVIFRR